MHLLLLSFALGVMFTFKYSIAQKKYQTCIASSLSLCLMLSLHLIALLKSMLVDVTEQGQTQGALLENAQV